MKLDVYTQIVPRPHRRLKVRNIRGRLVTKEDRKRPSAFNSAPNMATIRQPNLSMSFPVTGPTKKMSPIVSDPTHAETQAILQPIMALQLRAHLYSPLCNFVFLSSLALENLLPPCLTIPPFGRFSIVLVCLSMFTYKCLLFFYLPLNQSNLSVVCQLSVFQPASLPSCLFTRIFIKNSLVCGVYLFVYLFQLSFV